MMNAVLGRLMLLFPVWPVIAISSAILFYVRHSRRTNADERMPAVLYAAAVLVCGAVATFGGMQLGVAWACARPESGNLCGLVGVLVTGPIAGAVAVVLLGCGLLWMRPGQKPAD
jgi:tryptophan-rich sensory protein